MGNSKEIQNTDFNTVETVEYNQWIQLFNQVSSIQTALKDNPNAKGLKQARFAAYNVLADIQILADSLKHQPQHA
jgi:hypothetical protein